LPPRAQRADADVCVGDFSDCLGVVYAKVVKHGQSYHVFASHTQAGDSAERRATRLRQSSTAAPFRIPSRCSLRAI
jgi:hypothetical protein